MSTFYPMSNDQSGTTSNLCLSVPENAPYSESPVTSNMMYLSFSSSGEYTGALTGNTHLELPVAASIISQGITGVGNHAYNTWKDGRNEMLFMPTVDGSMNGGDDLLRADDPQMSLRIQYGIVNGQSLPLHESNVSIMQNQGLSLSLSTQMPVPSISYQPANTHFSFITSHQPTSGNDGPTREESLQNKSMHGSLSSYGHSNLATLISDSKYLSATKELLDEVANVGMVLKKKKDKSLALHNTTAMTDMDVSAGTKTEVTTSNAQEATANSDDLSVSEKQDLRNKVTKLLAMLDEVDRRYKQYFHQMQIIVSCFDAIAGCGSAKPYTSLALQTISCHFRCLRDAISGQIQAMRKTLGQPDNSSGKNGGLSRLRYIDQQLRQQRAIQQFGMMQQNAWRPQRGLPETSVSILRAWLFEHFLQPYPKDSEKLMLARQTGLSRSQVANWFINARVRLWKPMIEDMYKEEFGDIDVDSNSSSENPPKLKEDIQSSEDHEELQNTITASCQTSQISDSLRPSTLNQTMNFSESAAAFQNETADSYMNLKISAQPSIGEDTSLLQDALTHPDRSRGFFAYQMAELGQHGTSGVSLTLGLQQSNVGLPVSGNQQNLITVRGPNDVFGTAAPAAADADDFEYANVGDRQQRLSTHLLHDFVA